MPQTVTQIKQLLSDRGLRPRHRFGQNFLHDQNKLASILDAAAVGPEDVVLEVGPGTGTLTESLLERGARVVAVEIDDDLHDILRERFGADSDRLTLIHGDALVGKHALNPHIEAALGGRETPFKLVANLPYNIASPLLATLALDWPGLKTAVIMIQREVADRIICKPGSKTYGPLSVVLQAMMKIELITTLPPSCFWPRPKVDSAVLRLTRHDAPLTDDPHGLAAMAQRLFSRRRKQLGTILGREHPLPDGVDATQRPEELDVSKLIQLARLAD